MVPYSLDTNDSRFGRDGGGYVLGEQFVTYLTGTFYQLYAEGCDRPKMMSIGLHTGLTGALHRILMIAGLVLKQRKGRRFVVEERDPALFSAAKQATST